MPIIATKDKTAGDWLKREMWIEAGYCRKAVVVNVAGAITLKTGTVMGKVTADGKYKVAIETAVDGSQVADAIFIGYGPDFTETVDIEAATDTTIVVLEKGPAVVAKGNLVFDASFDDDAKLETAYAAFEAKGINVDESL